MLFWYGSESGKVFFIINLILIILLLLYTCELLIWLFIYELSYYFIKTPTYPFSIWLRSFLGSVLLQHLEWN